MVGYFNGNNQTVWVMGQGLVQTLLVHLPVSYFMSIQQPDEDRSGGPHLHGGGRGAEHRLLPLSQQEAPEQTGTVK